MKRQPSSSAFDRAPQRPVQTPVDQTTRLRQVFERFAVGLVIDVGANLGQFVAEIRSFYRGEVVSFETNLQVFAALKGIDEAGMLWRRSSLAIGRDCGERLLHVSPSHDFSSLLVPNAFCMRRFGADAAPARTEPVRVWRLDRALQAIDVSWENRRVFLKMDTQGSDLDVFSGTGACLKAVVAMQSELFLIPLYFDMPHWLDCLAVYEAAGFGVVDLYPVTRHAGLVIEYDCLLIRKDEESI